MIPLPGALAPLHDALAISPEAVGGVVGIVIFVATALVVSVADVRFGRVPDAVLLPSVTAGMVAAALGDGVVFVLSVAGALCGYGVMRGCRGLSRLLHAGRPGLGLGDCKLGGAIGVWLGPSGFLLTLALASLVALLAGLVTGARRATVLRFAPFLCFAGLVAAWPTI